jgi:RNA polymerase sigma-70 factor (ECF subfamily)
MEGIDELANAVKITLGPRERHVALDRGYGAPNVTHDGATVVEGEAAAFTRLYELHYDRVYRDVFYRLAGKHETDDVVQQVFLQAWRALGRYQQTGSPFIAWLLTIARNAVISYYRRDRKEASLDADFVDWPSDDHVEGAAEIMLEHERVRQTLQRLRPDYQQVLAMRFLDDLSYREIAAATGKTEAHVRVIQHRALQELRRILEPTHV